MKWPEASPDIKQIGIIGPYLKELFMRTESNV